METDGDSLALLAQALLRKGASPARVLALVSGAEESAAPARKGHGQGRTPKEQQVTHARVVDTLRALGRPLTARELSDRIPGLTPSAAQRHIQSGRQRGTIVQVNRTKPYTYTNNGAVVKPTVQTRQMSGYSKKEFLEVIKKRGPVTGAGIIAHLPRATQSAVYTRIFTGLKEGLIKRHGADRPMKYVIVAAPKTKEAAKQPVSKSAKSSPKEEAPKVNGAAKQLPLP